MMKIREDLISDLSRYLLGPLNGIHEKIAEKSDFFKGKIKPNSIYITGILAPPQGTLDESLGVDDHGKSFLDNLGRTDDTESANEQIDGDISLSVYNPLELTPFGYPISMGLAFSIKPESENDASIKICATWGTYELKESSEGENFWQRIPHFKILEVPVGEKTKYSHNDSDGQFRIDVRQKTVSTDEYYIYISLINTSQEDFRNISSFMFQTQIRVILKDSILLPLRKKKISLNCYTEESVLEQNYSKLRAYAKGRVTSAIWKELDPIQSAPGIIEGSAIFDWPDKEVIPNEQDRNDFLNCDVRTEWLPTYQHKAPSTAKIDVSSGYKPNPSDLAEISDPHDLEKALLPLLEAYQIFINNQKAEANNLTSEKIVENLERTHSRMRSGLDFLIKNTDARLAFKFANKAISLQQEWTKKTVYDWYPFQLGFILQVIRGVSDQESEDRRICDLLWFPTGGGKTEAYLALVAYILAYRRLKGMSGDDSYPMLGYGTAIISRYTLRLLTIQQFRRASALIIACEYLRRKGWGLKQDQMWGDSEFSLGLWVGGNVSPNSLTDGWYKNKIIPGAFKLLRNKENGKENSEPAQLLNCPSCNAILSLPYEKLNPEPVSLYLTTEKKGLPSISALELHSLKIKDLSAKIVFNYENSQIVKINITPSKEISKKDLQHFFRILIRDHQFPRILCCDVTRPGYFFDWKPRKDRKLKEIDFHIICPNPDCPLSGEWDLDVKSLSEQEIRSSLPYFKLQNRDKYGKFPLPIFTVDDHLYRNHPSFIIATVDKFARMAFLPKVGSFFGKISKNSRYYDKNNPNKTLRPPDIFIQDELHLIEGPLGSMVGIYEVAISFLSEIDGWSPKYITATATIRNAESQVKALYRRKVNIFPPLALSAEDNFFARSPEVSQRVEDGPSRLYIGVCVSGLSPQTTGMYLWGTMLQLVKEKVENAGNSGRKYDPYWTIVGYFNSRRELAAVSNLIRQDVVEFLGQRWGPKKARVLEQNDSIELSSRVDSIKLPAYLERISAPSLCNNSVYNTNTVVATSILGTGIDIDRLGIMIVHGQPKTTSQYIQSTGRVGRKYPGIVISFLRSTRIRDMDHYENFVGYHRSLYKSVEPVPVYPFSPGVIDRSIGPVIVSILRNLKPNSKIDFSLKWEKEPTTITDDSQSQFLSNLISYIVRQKNKQPEHLQPSGDLESIIDSLLARWKQIAIEVSSSLKYSETGRTRASSHVVLGDYLHQAEEALRNYRVVFPLAPNSLRTMEPTICLKT